MSVFNHPMLDELDALAPLFHDIGKRVERDPEDWAPLWDNELLRAITLMEVPDPWNPMPNCGGFFGSEPMVYGLLIAIAERMARHDANCVLALPTPTMAGFAVQVLGNAEQNDLYFRRYSAGKPGRSFFAITEPTVGSDATAGRTVLRDTAQGRRMDVEKKLVGAAKQANFGLIFARDERSKSHKMVMADADFIAGLKIERLFHHGLAGADLSQIDGRDIAVPDELILGHGLQRGLRDGFYAMNSVFERYRPVVATLAIGAARGLIDTMAELGVGETVLEPLRIRHLVFLDRLSKVAAAYDHGTPKVHETSSLKLDAVGFLDEAVATVFRAVPSRDIFQHPTLIKRCRDAKSYEYMEGTSNIHLLQAFRSYTAASA